jgi:Tfp pilus assembly protein PilN
MINLLPEQYKKSFISEYRLRVAVVLVGFLCLGGIAADGLLLPTYISSRQSQAPGSVTKAASKATAAGPSPAALHAELVAQTATLSQTLSVLSTTGSQNQAFTDIIPTILDQKPRGVSITNITYVLGGTVQISGTAATRDELAAFQAALQNQSTISLVNIPISDFAGDTDISFSITITPAAITAS